MGRNLTEIDAKVSESEPNTDETEAPNGER